MSISPVHGKEPGQSEFLAERVRGADDLVPLHFEVGDPSEPLRDLRPGDAPQFPPDERDEAQTVNLTGDFGDSGSGPTPVAIRVVGELQGKAPGARR